MKIYFDLTDQDLKKIFCGLIFLELMLVIAYIVDIMLGSPSWVINKLVDLDDEGSVATWFSSIQLFLVGLLLIIRSSGNREIITLPSATFFCILGLGFIFLSVDEAAAIHEKMSTVLKQAEFMPRFKGEHGIWIYIYGLVALFFLVVTLRNFIALWKHYRRAALIMFIGLVTFVTGAVVLEIVSYQFLRDDLASLHYVVEVALEEFLEMLGISIVLYSVLLLLLEVKSIDSAR